MIVLDTHVVLWWTLEPERLSRPARRAIDGAETLGTPVVLFWEVALLARKKRIKLGISAIAWMRDVLSLPRIQALMLTPEIAVAAESLKMHPDPADRFIVATAAYHNAALVTGDGTNPSLAETGDDHFGNDPYVARATHRIVHQREIAVMSARSRCARAVLTTHTRCVTRCRVPRVPLLSIKARSTHASSRRLNCF